MTGRHTSSTVLYTRVSYTRVPNDDGRLLRKQPRADGRRRHYPFSVLAQKPDLADARKLLIVLERQIAETM
jgi:hypothetical protein